MTDPSFELIREGAIAAVLKRAAVYTERVNAGTTLSSDGRSVIRTSESAHAKAIADTLMDIAAELREMPL